MTFEAIKQCAIRQDADALQRLLNPPQWSIFRFWETPPTGVSIDVRKRDNLQLTPAGELAQEGNFAAVEFLRINGASIDLIAHGFALGRYLPQVEIYRTKHGASIDLIAWTFAFVGNSQKAEEYRTQYGASIDAIADGFDCGGYMAEAQKYEALAASIAAERQPHIDQSTTLSKPLNEFKESLRKTPINLIQNYDYPVELCCCITLSPPVTPVRIFGYGPFDLEALLKVPKKIVPLRPDLTFKVQDIAPDFATRDALNTLHAQHVQKIANPPL